jgi:sugar lactone lactonase YvrE
MISSTHGKATRTPARSAAMVTSLLLVAGLLSVTPLAAAAPAAAGPWKIRTVAGGDGGPGPASRINIGSPCAVSFAGGRLYLGNNFGVDGVLVRSISMRTGLLSTPAGAADASQAGISGIPAHDAGLSWVCGLTLDHAGDLLISDGMNFNDGSPAGGDDVVRVVAARPGTRYGRPMTAGHIYTIAGGGAIGFAGDGGLATRAELSGPAGLAVDPVGNVIVADAGNGRVRVVAARTGTFYGRAMAGGHIYTIAGDGRFGFAGDGAAATRAALAIAPQGDGKVDLSEPWPVLGLDHAGNIVLADALNCRVRVVAARTGRFYGQNMRADDIYTIAGSSCGFSGDRGPATRARLGVLSGVAVDGAGNIVVADSGNDRVQVVAARTGRFYGTAMRAGDLYSVAGSGTLGTAGDGGPASRAEFAGLSGVTTDSAGNIVVADGSGVGAQGSYFANVRVRVVAARPGRFYGQRMTAGHVYAIAGAPSAFTGGGGLATHAQMGAGGMTLDRAGNRIITDIDDGRILVVPARPGRFYGVAMRAGHIYPVAGGGTGPPGGGRLPARVRLDSPSAVATDAAGNLLIGLYGGHEVCVLTAGSGRYYGRDMRAGRIYLLATVMPPNDLAVDRHGNILVASFPGDRVQLVAATSGRFYGQSMQAGHVYTIAGDGGIQYNGDGELATAAAVNPTGVALDAAGNIVIADTVNARVRIVPVISGVMYGQRMTAGHIYTIAGNGSFTDSGDGGPAVRAGVWPTSVAVDAAGNVLVADRNGRIRVAAVRRGVFYGQRMTARHIYRIAGGGARGLGDGGPAVQAELVDPTKVMVARSGFVYVADARSVRLLSP